MYDKEELKLAAEKYASQNYREWYGGPLGPIDDEENLILAFEEGAKWMKEQLIKNNVD